VTGSRISSGHEVVNTVGTPFWGAVVVGWVVGGAVVVVVVGALVGTGTVALVVVGAVGIVAAAAVVPALPTRWTLVAPPEQLATSNAAMGRTPDRPTVRVTPATSRS